jgi:hypothetical protein
MPDAASLHSIEFHSTKLPKLNIPGGKMKM